MPGDCYESNSIGLVWNGKNRTQLIRAKLNQVLQERRRSSNRKRLFQISQNILFVFDPDT
jgi:hypothetical protein